MLSVPKSNFFQRFVLASGSPRRKEILTTKGGLSDLEIIPSTYEEDHETRNTFDKSSLRNYIEKVALGKVTQVMSKDIRSDNKKTLYIGSDTVVAKDGIIYEKPLDKEDALRMLKSLCGSYHEVWTAVALIATNCSTEGPQTRVFTSTTRVWLEEPYKGTIERYVDTGESLDKAGGYGIQAQGAQLIKEIQGDYETVVGFPLRAFCVQLASFIDELEKSAST